MSVPPPLIYRGKGAKPGCLLVVGLHASGGTPASFAATSRWPQYADQHGFVYAGLASQTQPAFLDFATNLAYLKQAIPQIKAQEQCGSVLLTGFSAGSDMAMHVLAQDPTLVDAYAIVSGWLPKSVPYPPGPRDVCWIGGDHDAIPLGGGNTPAFGPVYGLQEECDVAVAAWQLQPVSTPPVPGVNVTRWNGVATVQLAIVVGGSHQYPGAPQATGVDRNYDATAAIWQFVSSIAPPSPTPTPPPPPPPVTFDGDPALGVKPYAALGGGAQAANYGTPDSNGRHRGNIYFGPAPDGRDAVLLENPATPAGFSNAVCNLNIGSQPFPEGRREFIGVSFWIPKGFSIPNQGYGNAGPEVNVSEWHFTAPGAGASQPAICFMLRPGSIVAQVNCGPWDPVAKHYEYGTWNVGELVLSPKLYEGQWNGVILEALWTTGTTGYFRGWHKGGRAWHASPLTYSGKPTVNWVGALPTSSFHNPLMNYGPVLTAPLTVTAAGCYIAPTIKAVQKALP